VIEGQKVVCVNDSAPWWLRWRYTTWIKKGTTYVVRGVFLGQNTHGSAGEVGVYLLGITNPFMKTPPYPELGYASERFRPIEELPLKEKILVVPAPREVVFI
jgi:hypothetical protein